jgi:hypothetical protein
MSLLVRNPAGIGNFVCSNHGSIRANTVSKSCGGRGCGMIQPGHRVGRVGAGLERIDDHERCGFVEPVRRVHQSVAGGVDCGGVLVPFGKRRLALAGRFGDALAGAERPPIIDAVRDRRGPPAQIGERIRAGGGSGAQQQGAEKLCE